MIVTILLTWTCFSVVVAWLLGRFIAVSDERRGAVESDYCREYPSSVSGNSYMDVDEGAKAIAT